jgi:hypothetical protein
MTSYNGRVNISSQSPLTLNSFYKHSPTDNSAFYVEAVQGTFTPNALSNMFFSCNNIDVLQEGIRYKVYQLTNEKHVIGRQSDKDLKVVMRSIYLQYSKNLSTDIIGQVRELNKLVLDWCVREVFSNLQQYDKYVFDVSTLPMPMERSTIATTKGSRTLERKTFI